MLVSEQEPLLLYYNPFRFMLHLGRKENMPRYFVRWFALPALLVFAVVSTAYADAAEAVESLSSAGTVSEPVTAPSPSTTLLTTPTDTVSSGGPFSFIDFLHGEISGSLLTTAVWLDSFFGDERYEAESNQSHFKVSDTALYEDGKWTRYRPDYELRLVLPQLRQKTRLVISGDMWTEADSPSAVAENPPASPPSHDREMNTSIQVFLPLPDRHTTMFRGGLKYHAGKMVYYAGPRYRYLLPLSSWTFRFTEDMVWGTDKGWESKTWFDLERPIPHDLFFRATAEGTWTEGVDGYVYSFTALLRQPLDARRAVQYEWVNSFHTRPVEELTEVKFIFRYRQQIWRRWLFLELAPQYRYPRDQSFHAVPGINFKLEMIFGARK